MRILGLEPGTEKVVLYSTDGQFRHAALQLENGKWTSKLGNYEDVEHDSAEALLGGELEKIDGILMRPRRFSHPIEEATSNEADPQSSASAM